MLELAEAVVERARHYFRLKEARFIAALIMRLILASGSRLLFTAAAPPPFQCPCRR